MSTKFKFTVFIIVAFFLIGCGDSHDSSEFHVTKVYHVIEAQPRAPLYDAENSVNGVFFVEGHTNTTNYRLSCDEGQSPCFYVHVGDIVHIHTTNWGRFIETKESPGTDQCFTIEEESTR